MTVKLLAKWKEGMEVSVWEGKEGVWGGYGGECEEGYEGECGKEGMEVSVWEGKEGVWGGYGGECEGEYEGECEGGYGGECVGRRACLTSCVGRRVWW